MIFIQRIDRLVWELYKLFKKKVLLKKRTVIARELFFFNIDFCILLRMLRIPYRKLMENNSK